MSVGGKLFWGMFGVELLVAGWIGWQIAHARYHPWEVKPKARKPNPLGPLLEEDGEWAEEHRGQQQQPGHAISMLNTAVGEFTADEDVS